MRKMSFEEFLSSKYCPDDCFGCVYNIPLKAHCTYKGRCYYYDALRSEPIFEQFTLDFDV